MSGTKISQAIFAILLCGVLSFGMTSCAAQHAKDGYSSAEINDPIEPVNRGIFAFNDFLDKILIEPVATVYKALVPDFARDSVQNFMHNLKSPIIVANDLLQGKVGRAGVDTARFVINTTAGIGGLVDVASAQGLNYQPADFGETLAVWGFGDGFYLVIPVIGPSTLRDTAGLAVDSYADPVRLYAHNTNNDWIYYTRTIVEGIDTRARYLKAVDDLRRNSLDYYAAVRSAYVQKRHALISTGNGKHADAYASPAIPDYDAKDTSR